MKLGMRLSTLILLAASPALMASGVSAEEGQSPADEAPTLTVRLPGDVEMELCRIPAGRGIFFPLFSNISFAPEFLATPPCEDLAGEVDQIRCDVTDDTPIAPNVGLEVVLDGAPVADLFGYRVQSPPGGFTFALGPLFEVFGFEPGDRFPAVVDGYWILLRPPSPGAHTLSFRVDFGADGTDDLGADYQLFIAGADD